MTSGTTDEAGGASRIWLWLRRFEAWAERIGLARKFMFFLMLAAAGMGVATYPVFTRSGLSETDPSLVLGVLITDLVLLLVLAIVVARRVVAIWAARRRGSAGSRLHTRLVLMFGLVAATPAIIMSVFFALFFDLGVQ